MADDDKKPAKEDKPSLEDRVARLEKLAGPMAQADDPEAKLS